MTKIAYGRFVLVHEGHEKLFSRADIALVSKGSQEHCDRLSSLYPGTRFLSVNTTVFKALELFNWENITIVLGEDNTFLGQQLLKAGLVSDTEYVRRDSMSSSSSKIRGLFEQGATSGDLFAKGFFTSGLKALYARERFDNGY
jgi:hypothetical protein